MLRVGSANPRLMFPKPEFGLRVNIGRISHAPKIRHQQGTTGLATSVVRPPHNLRYLMGLQALQDLHEPFLPML